MPILLFLDLSSTILVYIFQTQRLLFSTYIHILSVKDVVCFQKFEESTWKIKSVFVMPAFFLFLFYKMWPKFIIYLGN